MKKFKEVLKFFLWGVSIGVIYLISFVGLVCGSVLFIQFLHLIVMGKWN